MSCGSELKNSELSDMQGTKKLKVISSFSLTVEENGFHRLIKMKEKFGRGVDPFPVVAVTKYHKLGG